MLIVLELKQRGICPLIHSCIHSTKIYWGCRQYTKNLNEERKPLYSWKCWTKQTSRSVFPGYYENGMPFVI